MNPLFKIDDSEIRSSHEYEKEDIVSVWIAYTLLGLMVGVVLVAVWMTIIYYPVINSIQ